MIDDVKICKSLFSLEQYVRSQDYSGYDPYDVLNAIKLKAIKNKFIKISATQIFVYSPFNSRRFFRIEPEKNPKAIGLFLQAYCKLFKYGFIQKNEFEDISKKFFEFLIQNRSEGYSKYCWGFNFDWQDTSRYAKKGTPTIVITSFIANSFLDLYEITKDKKYLDIARNSCNFLLEDLYITKTEKGICFSYTPIDRQIVHNANMLGAALLARVYSITKENILLEYSKRAYDFTISYQKDDGSWSYDTDLKLGKESKQIDFHQGFILDSVCDALKYIDSNNRKYLTTLSKGAKFYITKQFNSDGRSYWRLPRKWPVDIHHQAQGIITFSKLYSFYKEDKYLEFSKKIAEWTIKNMQDEKGYFYFQKWPFLTNKISYIRWGQAWMMLALSYLIEKTRKINE